jgi:transforming growth factor-beta-induced protein
MFMHQFNSLTPLAAMFFASLTGSLACGDDDSTPSTPNPNVDGGASTDSSNSNSSNSSDRNSSDDSDSTDTDETSADGGVIEAPDGSTGDGGGALPTTAAYVNGSAEFSVLAAALAETGLDAALDGNGEYTVFAPTDEAFALLPEGLWASLNAQQRTELLRYHVVEGLVDSDTVVEQGEADTLIDQDLKVQVINDGVYINGLTKLVTRDVKTANGVIHVIDSVLVPGPFPGTVADVLGAYPRLSTLFGAASAEVGDALQGDGLTLFAPTNDAFVGVDLSGVDDLDSVLLYHALPDSVSASAVGDLRSARTVGGGFVGIKVGDDVQLNDGQTLATVTYTDIQVASGDEGSTIHLIDKVLLPPPSIAEVAANLGLSTLVDLLGVVTLVDADLSLASVFAGEGAFTVFAPTDEAFDGVSAVGLGLDLGDVVTAHAIDGVFDSKAALDAVDDDGESPRTLTGSTDNTLAVRNIDGTLTINGLVQVVETDIPASNGIIHIVDSVIIPSDIEFPGNIVEAVSAYPLLSSLTTAVTNAADEDVAGALAGSGPFTLFAPINPAFEGIDVSADLSATLLYHALGDAYDSAAIVDLGNTTELETLSGGDVTVDPNALTVEGAAIIRADLRTRNGVIHVIDEVLSDN